VILGDFLPAQRTLARSAAWLCLLSMLVGIPLAMADQAGLDRAELVGAHRNALMGVFWMVAVAWSMPLLRYGPAGQGRLTWLLILANWANALVPMARAWLHVDGRHFTGETANDALFLLLTLTVRLPSLVAAIGWVDGFRGQR